MVRAVLVAARHPSQPNRLDAYREVLNRKLTGDNIDARPPAMIRRAGLTAAVLNPGSTAELVTRTTGATVRAKPSGRVSARVLGRTSEKMTTAAVIASVA